MNIFKFLFSRKYRQAYSLELTQKLVYGDEECERVNSKEIL